MGQKRGIAHVGLINGVFFRPFDTNSERYVSLKRVKTIMRTFD
jgi:hypothetical protein